MPKSILAAAIDAAVDQPVVIVGAPAIAAAVAAPKSAADRKADAEAALAAANADLAKEAPAGIDAATALELLSAAYPTASAVLDPLAEMTRKGCTEAELAKAIMVGVVKGSKVEMSVKTETTEVTKPGTEKTTEVKVNSPQKIYGDRNAAMRTDQPAKH